MTHADMQNKTVCSKEASRDFQFRKPNLLPSFFYSYHLRQMTQQITKRNTQFCFDFV